MTKKILPVTLILLFIGSGVAFIPENTGDVSTIVTQPQCKEPDIFTKKSLVLPSWRDLIPQDDKDCLGLSTVLAANEDEVEQTKNNMYWYHPDIHTFGNTGLSGGVHAFLAPLATKIIDRAAYENIDVRSKVAEELRRKCVTKTRARVLDLCSGVGMSTRALTSAFNDAELVLGIDSSPEMIQMARSITWNDYRVSQLKGIVDKTRQKLTRSNIKNDDQTVPQYAQGNSEKTTLPSQSFDLVTIMYSFHEAPYLGRQLMLQEARRILKHNGTLAVVDISTDYSPSPSMLAGEPYVLEYQKNIMRQMKTLQGFGDIKSKEYHTIVPGHVGMWLFTRKVRKGKRVWSM